MLPFSSLPISHSVLIPLDQIEQNCIFWIALVFKIGTICYPTAKPTEQITGGIKPTFNLDWCPVWYRTGWVEAGSIPNRLNKPVLRLLGQSDAGHISMSMWLTRSSDTLPKFIEVSPIMKTWKYNAIHKFWAGTQTIYWKHESKAKT